MRSRGAAFWWLTLLALWTTINGVVADWNHSHVFNPAWPPHAKFHDAVSILAGVVLGLIALVYLWRGGSRSTDHLEFACVAMAAFWAALLLGFTFPGTAETAAEHPEVVPVVLGIRINEVFLSTTALAGIAIGWWLEARRRRAAGAR